MNKYDKISRLLAAFALGELTPEEQAEVKAHLARCNKCGSELKRLQKLLESTRRLRELSPDVRMCESAKCAIFIAIEDPETALRPRPNVRAEFIWRIIIRSPITRLVGAMTIVVAAILCIYLLSAPSPAYGIMDVPGVLRQARTIHIKGWQYAWGWSGLYDPNLMRPGQKQTRGPLEIWKDMETDCMKFTKPDKMRIKNGRVVVSSYTTVFDGEFIMAIVGEQKEVTFTKLTPYQRLLKKRKKDSLLYLQPIFLPPELLGCFKRTDKERINGEVFDIWRAEIKAPSYGGLAVRIKSWISPRTGHVGRVEIWTKPPQANWFQFSELDQIEYNVAIPRETFVTEVPPGYTAINTKDNAYVSQLYQNRNPVGGGQIIASYACFTLKDGSVILGWSCTTGWPDNDWQSDRYQETIFKNLIAGGELPKLPFEFYTVTPIDEDPGVEYHGRHLAYTRKGNIFHEWALYVPGRRLDKYYGRLSYNLFTCSSRDANAKGTETLGETGDIQIKTEHDFDLYVLGAMVELSDEGKPPPDVTYESVLHLTEQIRSQLK